MKGETGHGAVDDAQEKGRRVVQPCNFRSAGRLSNESARALSGLHETLARNLMNSLDVYLGTGLEVKLAALEQMPMDEYRAVSQLSGYCLPCGLRPSLSTVLLEIDNPLMFTMIDLLLGGSGAALEEARDLTEIDEEIMLGAATLVAQQVERAWNPAISSLVPGSCVKPMLAHKVFPTTEKVLRIRFELTLAGMTGALHLSFPASFGGHLVRNVKTELSQTMGIRYMPLPSLQHRLLDCSFTLAGVLPGVQVRVRELAAIEEGSVLKLSAAMSTAGRLTLEGKPLFEAIPVRQSNQKAVQLLGLTQSTGWLED
ncbi:MAG TPA: FliM/FliN family flagellar motor switch protein [Acidobacteriaceae bacterium]